MIPFLIYKSLDEKEILKIQKVYVQLQASYASISNEMIRTNSPLSNVW